MTLVVLSSYCQYPITKVIGQDTVVIMTLKQGLAINDLYKDYNNKISVLKDTIKTKNLNYDSLHKEFNRKKDSIFYWEGKYNASRELYIPKQRNIDKEEAFQFLQKVLLMGIIVLQFSQLR